MEDHGMEQREAGAADALAKYTEKPLFDFSHEPDHKKAMANARLIAAAPELLEALRAMQTAAEEIAVEFIQHKRATNWKIVNDAYVAAAKAIAKVSGNEKG